MIGEAITFNGYTHVCMCSCGTYLGYQHDEEQKRFMHFIVLERFTHLRYLIDEGVGSVGL